MKKVLWVILVLALLALVVALACWLVGLLIEWAIYIAINWIAKPILWIVIAFSLFAMFCMAIDG